MDQNTSLFQLNLDAQNSYTLRSASSWARVLGIVSMIMGILFIILGILVQQTVNSVGYTEGGMSSSTLANAGLVAYVLIGLMMIISSIFSLNAGNKIGQALKTNDQAALNAGFAGIRNYFAFWAILTILGLVMVLITILGSMSM